MTPSHQVSEVRDPVSSHCVGTYKTDRFARKERSRRSKQARKVVRVAAGRCRIWSLHNRLLEFVTPESCSKEIASFRRVGQLQPVLARPIKTNDYDYEIVYGVRRHFVAKHLGVPLLLSVADLTDQEALCMLDSENRARKKLSPFEQGLAYRKWLDAGMFPSQRALAHAIGIPKSKVSRLIQVSELPLRVIRAFGHPDRIKEFWATEIIAILNATKGSRVRLLTTADRLSSAPPLQATDVFKCLTGKPGTAAQSDSAIDERKHNTTCSFSLFVIQRTATSVNIVIPASRITSEKVIEALEKVVNNTLKSFI